MSSTTPTGASRRRLLLLATLALVLAVAMYAWRPDATAPAAVTIDSAAASARVDTARDTAAAAADSAERAWVEATLRRWSGEQHWLVAFATDSTAEFHEPALVDSSAADLLEALVRLPALRDSGGAIELLGGGAPTRARLGGPVDSLLRAAAENQFGCVFPPVLSLARASGAGGWSQGFVPGMASVVTPADTHAVAHRGEALRLLAMLRDTSGSAAVADTLRAGQWSEPALELWREDGREILVASRTRALRDSVGEEEQIVIADREAGTAMPFVRGYAWHSYSYPDEQSSTWVERAMRLGPRRRLVFVLGHRGKEGGAGSMLVRGASDWHEAMSWSWGC